jgi:hypothetical protein
MAMITQFFSLRVGSVELHSVSADMTVSSSFNPLETLIMIAEKLKGLRLIPDQASLQFTLKGKFLYIEGLAYEEAESPKLFSSLG